MWSSGGALTINDDWTLFSVSPQVSFSLFDGDFSVSASATAALVLKVRGDAGALSLGYDINANFSVPNVVAPGQEFSVLTSAGGLANSPRFDGRFPTFDIQLNAIFTAAFSLNFSSDLLGSDSYSYNYNNTIPLIDLHSGDHKKLADGFELFLPRDFNQQVVQAGTGPLPNVTLNATTPDFATSKVDLIKVITDIADDVGIEIPPLSDSFLGGDISFDLISATLTAGLAFTQQFTFIPQEIDVTISTPWGESLTVPLGEAATFNTPANWAQDIKLTTKYVLHGNVVNQTGFVGTADLDLSILSGSAEYFGSFGPLYTNDFLLYDSGSVFIVNPGGPDGFYLDGFNVPTGSLTIALGSALAEAPGGVLIDTSKFSANNSAYIQQIITAASGGMTQTNLFDLASQTGSAAPTPAAFNAAIIKSPQSSFALPQGFQIGIIEPGASGASLTGNSTAALLAAALNPGETATLTAGGRETMIAGQDGDVTFNITSSFAGAIAGLEPGDSIHVTDIAANDISFSGSTLSLSYTVPQSFLGFTLQIPTTYSFQVGGNLNLLHFSFASDGGGGTLISLYEPAQTTISAWLNAEHAGGLSSYSFNGTAEAGSTVRLMEGNRAIGSAVADSSGNWSAELSLAAGQHVVTAVSSDTAGNIALRDRSAAMTVNVTPADVTPHSAALGDFNGDSDLLFRHDNGLMRIYSIEDYRPELVVNLGTLGNEFKLQGMGDFDNDGDSDLLFRQDNGLLRVFSVENYHTQSASNLGSLGNDFKFQGIGDFDGDGDSDLLFRQDNGSLRIYSIENGHIQSTVNLGGLGNDFQFLGTGDFDGDSVSDLLFRQDNGSLRIYSIENHQIKSAESLGSIGNELNFLGTGDFDADRDSDLVFQKDDGELLVYTIQNNQVRSAFSMGALGNEFAFQTIGDFDKDGDSDLLFRHDNGSLRAYAIEQGHIQAALELGSLGNDFHLMV